MSSAWVRPNRRMFSSGVEGVQDQRIESYAAHVRLEPIEGGRRYEARLEDGADHGWLRFSVFSEGRLALVGNPIYLDRR